MEQQILCFQHCERKNILCFDLPEVCIICQENIEDTGLKIPPYRIKSPFSSGAENSCSIVIKPTFGTFLKDYTKSANLHIGITLSTGAVYDFDENGLNFNCSGWDGCLGISLLDDLSYAETWDARLAEYIDKSDASQQNSTDHNGANIWTAKNYDELLNNCYDFVYGATKYIGMSDLFSAMTSRSEFCEKVITPGTSRVGKYISLYRRIVNEQFVLQDESV